MRNHRNRNDRSTLNETLVDSEDVESPSNHNDSNLDRDTKGSENTNHGATEIDYAAYADENGEVDVMDVYQFRQQTAYCSIFFSVVQVIILILMMWQCGVAPLQINPMVGPYPDGLSHWGGKNGVLIIEDGQWWRLITPIFLHAGILHLLGNVSVQMDMGAFFEKEWGSVTWLVVYISSAIGGSILSTISKPDIVSVGSSGAVCGLFGAKMSEVFVRCCESKRTLQGRAGHAVRKAQCGGVVCSVILVGAMSFIPYVDWAAHLGGLLAGMAVGFICFSLWVKTLIWRILWWGVGMFLTVVGFAVASSYMYNDIEASDQLRDVCGYYRQYFQEYECHCMVDEYNFWGNGD